jgi:hypothetical protein
MGGGNLLLIVIMAIVLYYLLKDNKCNNNEGFCSYNGTNYQSPIGCACTQNSDCGNGQCYPNGPDGASDYICIA